MREFCQKPQKTVEDWCDMALHIGTSGWSYNHWEGVLYPLQTPVHARLRFYVARFPTGSYSRCMHLRNMMAKSAALGQGVLAKK